MARAMASPLRVKNTAYFDIAAIPFHQRTPGIPASPTRWRLCAHHSTDKPARPIGCDAGEENGAGWRARRRVGPVLGYQDMLGGSTTGHGQALRTSECRLGL